MLTKLKLGVLAVAVIAFVAMIGVIRWQHGRIETLAANEATAKAATSLALATADAQRRRAEREAIEKEIAIEAQRRAEERHRDIADREDRHAREIVRAQRSPANCPVPPGIRAAVNGWLLPDAGRAGADAAGAGEGARAGEPARVPGGAGGARR